MSEIERCPRCDARVRDERYCPLGGFTTLLDEARQVAVDRMIGAARERRARPD